MSSIRDFVLHMGSTPGSALQPRFEHIEAESVLVASLPSPTQEADESHDGHVDPRSQSFGDDELGMGKS